MTLDVALQIVLDLATDQHRDNVALVLKTARRYSVASSDDIRTQSEALCLIDELLAELPSCVGVKK